MHVEKKLLLAVLIFSLIASYTSTANAGTITVEIVPSVSQIGIGEQFHVNVTISNVEATDDLVGMEFKVTWNTTLLTGINMTLPQGHIFQAAQDDDNLWVIRKTVDNTAGEAWYMVTCNDLNQGYTAGYLPLTGSGVVCQIFFNATNVEGISSLSFEELPPTNLKVKLSNGAGQPITNFEVVESSIGVIPEFTNLLLSMLLLAASTIIIISYKKFPKKT
jgi:hypothetical protein